MNGRIDTLWNKAIQRSFEMTVHKLKGKPILLYGAGGFGVEMLHHLRQAGLSPVAFLDRRAVELVRVEGLPVSMAEQAPFDRKDSAVLLCVVMDKEERRQVLAHLGGVGFANVIEAQSLRCLLVQPDDRTEADISEYYRRRSGAIQRAEELLADSYSREIYRNSVYAHATGDYSRCVQWESPMVEQYFPVDIPMAKGYQRFLDCGGYTGDTVEQVLKHMGTIDACAVFEPNSENYARMAARLAGLAGRIGQRWLFPCAVTACAGIHAFSQGTGSGTLSERGDSVAQTVTLDQAVPDFHPTCIKMDIEGAELAALRGAKELISRDKPDLAVCVYHAVNHIWDIPLLVDSWNLGYRFYLRSYNACTMETVLYATSDSEVR